MDIKQAKEEIRRAVLAYTERTPDGALCMPLVHQRPLLLMGPPGVGKTAVFYQLAQELGINLVSYTMTHHTRQSALGLPLIREKTFGGKPYSATEYTMSEILASVYERMEQTGIRTGILFLDEINCVSETLMPAMLQLLQSKQFGTHRLPEGWVIAAAGNPPAYNESARSFDTVTMDRVRLLEISENYPVWRDYAHAKGLHPAVLSYLELNPEHETVKTLQRVMTEDPVLAKDYAQLLLSELLARVEALCRRVGRTAGGDEKEKSSSLGMLTSGEFVLDENRRVLLKAGQPIELTQVEFQIMELFFRNPGIALVREKILKGVWGENYFGDVKIVDVNIRRLRMKVEDEPSHPTHILTVWGYGYRWEE